MRTIFRFVAKVFCTNWATFSSETERRPSGPQFIVQPAQPLFKKPLTPHGN